MILRRKSKKAHIVVTAGPTRERIDPVRFISNYSTGVFGYKIAEEASSRALRVTLISGPTALKRPAGVKMVNVETALEMKDAVTKAVKDADCLIMAAAVSDWRPARPSIKKLKRGSGGMTFRFVENPDILAGIGRDRRKDMCLVGFALETDDLEDNAVKKMMTKGMDMIVANRISRSSIPFGDNYIDIFIYDARGGKAVVRDISKSKAAKIILDKALRFNI